MTSKKFLAATIASLAIISLSGGNAQAQGWPTLDPGKAVASVGELVQNIQQIVSIPQKVTQIKTVISSVGPLGQSIGGDLMGAVQGKMGDAMGKMNSYTDPVVESAKGSADQGAKTLKDSFSSKEKPESISTEEAGRISAERKAAYEKAVANAYAVSTYNLDRVTKEVPENIKTIKDQAANAQDVRGDWSANTVAVVDICSELSMLTGLEAVGLQKEVYGHMMAQPAVLEAN